MVYASLKNAGQTQLGKVGTVSLKEIFATGSGQTLTGTTGYYGYDRIYDDGGTNEYKQINPFEVQGNSAPDPATWTAASGYSLVEWDAYIQWNSSEAKSSNFDLTAYDYDSATFSWSLPAGYSRNTGELRQYLFVDTCVSALACADQDATADGVGGDSNGAYIDDQTSYEQTGLNPNQRYVCTIVTLWDERGTGTSERVSDSASTKTTLTLGTKNTYDHIYFQTSSCPTCSSLGSINYDTSTYVSCGGFTSTVYTNSGDTSVSGLSIGDCLFTVSSGSPCAVCSSPPSGWYYIDDGSYYVEVSPSTGCVTTNPNICGI